MYRRMKEHSNSARSFGQVTFVFAAGQSSKFAKLSPLQVAIVQSFIFSFSFVRVRVQNGNQPRFEGRLVEARLVVSKQTDWFSNSVPVCFQIAMVICTVSRGR